MYTRYTYQMINSNEISIFYKGRYGSKGERRAKRKKASPEQIRYQNQKNKELNVLRLIQANFFPNDIWACLKYPAGTRISIDEIKDFMNKKFIRGLRKDYRKRGEELKYIYRLEIGKHGSPHIHILINRIYGADLLVQKNWGPLCHFTPLRTEGNFRKLAAYMTKPLPEEFEQMSFFDTQEIKRLSTYSPSRNLVRPEPEKKSYKRRTVRKIVQEGITPTPGYYIDRDSVRMGVNEFTGMSYIHYSEKRLDTRLRVLRPPQEVGT
jgi:hypothetical protein